MARLAVFASGTGSNFVAIVAALKAAQRHNIEFLLCDVQGAPVLARAAEYKIPTFPVSYKGQAREAIVQYEEALRLRPDDERTRENLRLAREAPP